MILREASEIKKLETLGSWGGGGFKKMMEYDARGGRGHKRPLKR